MLGRGMERRAAVAVENRLPAVLRQRRMTWGELGRRSLLAPRLLARLRAPDANPRLVVAERVATVLGVAIEDLWHLAARRRRPGS